LFITRKLQATSENSLCADLCGFVRGCLNDVWRNIRQYDAAREILDRVSSIFSLRNADNNCNSPVWRGKEENGMIVAVTPELTRLAGQLRELGYDVVTYGAYRRPVDALVYSGQGLAAREVGANLTGANTGGSYGVLMVNASNKTVSQIDNSLKNRAYTPLF
jgi:hypothetical protein